MKIGKFEIEVSKLDNRFPYFSCGHYKDKFEDTFYLKMLWFNFYWSK